MYVGVDAVMHYISLPTRFLHRPLHLYFSIDGAVVYHFYLMMLDYYDFLLLTRMPKPRMNIFRIFVLFSPNVSNIADSIMYYHVMIGLIPFVLSNYDELLYVRTTIDIDTTSVQCILRDFGA